VSATATIAGPRCAAVDGFSLHPHVRVAANDRDGLEHLARYLSYQIDLTAATCP